MSRIARYAETLSPAERDRFADLLEECTAREAAIAENAVRAEEALQVLRAREDEFWQAVRVLAEQAARLRHSIGRLYLLTVPARGQVS